MEYLNGVYGLFNNLKEVFNMNYLDIINGLFEVIGGGMVWLNVFKIRKDKEVKGFDWKVSGFFSSWGLWNLVFYWGVGCWLSWLGGIVLCLGNCVWLYYVMKYKD